MNLLLIVNLDSQMVISCIYIKTFAEFRLRQVPFSPSSVFAQFSLRRVPFLPSSVFAQFRFRPIPINRKYHKNISSFNQCCTKTAKWYMHMHIFFPYAYAYAYASLIFSSYAYAFDNTGFNYFSSRFNYINVK